ncbi:caprice family protein [Populus alba x Populus x berolinensis]|uniref:Caprice family protein n=2 Tax=Populus TaxID=3689 RepID=A0A4U5QXS0_POPAL|nr:caprice family protein [Populus alba x Populus x berolinensis]KAJ6972477.1 caprice family protein [Populus alba x Populus x berolinensis]TKS14437.1 caprice family protein [Populus alba]
MGGNGIGVFSTKEVPETVEPRLQQMPSTGTTLPRLLPGVVSFLPSFFPETRRTKMDRRRKKQAKTTSCCSEQEVSSIEWEFINMSEQEEDLIYRMHNLVGDRWALIAGRIPGRKAEEIERFWLMRHGEGFASRRREQKGCRS